MVRSFINYHNLRDSLNEQAVDIVDEFTNLDNFMPGTDFDADAFYCGWGEPDGSNAN
jgi:hypothetical protein